MPSPHAQAHDTYIRRYLETGKKKIIGIGREVQGLRKDGSVFPLELAVSEIKIGDQHHFTGIVRDISQRKRIEEQLRKQQEEVHQHRERLAHFDRISTMGEMASGLAHEINQPLTAISSYARACHRLLTAGLTDASELLETLDKISAQAQRAGDIIHSLRAFVRKRESKRTLCNLNDLIGDAVILAETDAGQHQFQIEQILADTTLMVIVDPIQIQQVILNLIRNAAEAMVGIAPPGTAVTVVVTTEVDNPARARVAVIDKGIGVADDKLDKLFEPFFTTKPTGTGIGLAISRTIVTAHGGRLWLERNADGQGITLYFTLPLETRVRHE
jgi:two-component system sensor kinase FixL